MVLFTITIGTKIFRGRDTAGLIKRSEHQMMVTARYLMSMDMVTKILFGERWVQAVRRL